MPRPFLMNPIDKYDGGIVFYGYYGIAKPAAYTDILGQQRDPVLLANDGTETFMPTSYESAYFRMGLLGKFNFQVEVKTRTSSSTADLKLHGDVQTGATVDSDSPLVAAYNNAALATANTHTFAAVGKTLLQTANYDGVAVGAIGVLHGSTTPPGTYEIIVRLRVGL